VQKDLVTNIIGTMPANPLLVKDIACSVALLVGSCYFKTVISAIQDSLQQLLAKVLKQIVSKCF
jgi:hypothetical protein